MPAANKTMRGLIVVLILAGLGVLSYWQKRDQKPSAVALEPVTSQSAISSPTPSPHVSDVNWMKRSLDRTRDVAGKARAQTKENQDP
jgi:hypothetical protein